jgi:hypothetical protein
LRYGHEDGIVGSIGGVTTSVGRDGNNGTKTVCRRGWVDVGKRLAVEDSTVLATSDAHAPPPSNLSGIPAKSLMIVDPNELMRDGVAVLVSHSCE